MLTDPYKMTTDELYEELSESYAREAGEKDGRTGIFDPSEAYGLAETLAYQEGYDAAFRPVDDYKIDVNGIIVSPGKFEGCPAVTPKLWSRGLEGMADDEFEGGFGFKLILGEDLESKYLACILTESDNGFIYFEGFQCFEAYRKAIEECQNAENSEDSEDSEA